MDEKTPLISAEAYPQPTRPTVAWTNVDDSQATINCQVCNHVVPLHNRQKQLVVRCPNCTEATPIKGPPAGKQYVRCPCNCLLVCSASTTRVGCPRPECQKVIVLSDNDNGATSRTDPISATRDRLPAGGTFGQPHSLRVACGNCCSPFSVDQNPVQAGSRHSALISCLSGGTSAGAAGLIAAGCPHCRKLTSIGPGYARVHLVVYGFVALVFLIIAIGVTLGTLQTAKEKKALYFLWSVLYLISIALGLRAATFLFMPVSSVEVPVLQI
ncbi:Type 2 phosphatidylinositol 4 5-bisphosphate 4-phosphatase [Fasciola gigantica]|uniref:Phosphatidylinositol-4,5-bisphosphate 4-phosphatase n=1 Tax=Fasciola gigantica TaxID=46835 RepID=A0A504YMI3_FASGI|nr:Type 2 phosphatidylinositol 4 5-bisphosphate 4-phosphatase [Fasciola gigantica]